MNKRSIIAGITLILISSQPLLGIPKTKLAPREKYLVLDSRVIASVDNARLAVGKVTKHSANPLFIEDKATVEERKKTRYRARGREMGICYATSKDGLVWKKPELGLMNYDPKNRSNRAFFMHLSFRVL